MYIEPKQFYSYQLDIELKSGDAIVSLDDECVKLSAKTYENCVQVHGVILIRNQEKLLVIVLKQI